MPMPMPTSMPMLMPRCRCRDFQMALNLFNVIQIYITDQKIKQPALQINLQCYSNFFELRKLYSVKPDFWNSQLKLRFLNPLSSNWYNISGRIHVHYANEYGNWGLRAGGHIIGLGAGGMINLTDDSYVIGYAFKQKKTFTQYFS